MQQQNIPHISFLIVNYNSRDVLSRCLRELGTLLRGVRYEVLIANNDVEPLTVRDPRCVIHHIGENIGFGRAHNYLAKRATGDILCILNPDTYAFSKNFLTLANEITPKGGIVAPALLERDGSRQPWTMGGRVTPLSIIATNITKRPKPWLRDVSCHTEWVSGAVFFIPRTLFLEVNGFDEGYFLYYEDVDLCRRIRDRGHTIIWNPNVTVTHTSGASTRDTDIQKKHYFTSQRFYITKFYGSLIGTLFYIVRKLIHPV